MKSLVNKKKLSIEMSRIKKLKGVMIRCGNRERSHAFLLNLYTLLKQGSKKELIGSKYQSITFEEQKPLAIINKCLYRLMPAFVFTRVIKSGKLFELPIPISNNHASFKASYWLLKASLQNNKSALTLPFLLTQEIYATLNNEGAALSYLQNFIEIALDQRPFMRYVKKKRKVISRSKRTYAGYRLRKIYQKRGSNFSRHNNQYYKKNRRVNLHSLRRQARIYNKKSYKRKALKKYNTKVTQKRNKQKFQTKITKRKNKIK